MINYTRESPPDTSLLIPTSLDSVNKIVKNFCFKVRLDGKIYIDTKEYLNSRHLCIGSIENDILAERGNPLLW